MLTGEPKDLKPDLPVGTSALILVFSSVIQAQAGEVPDVYVSIAVAGAMLAIQCELNGTQQWIMHWEDAQSILEQLHACMGVKGRPTKWASEITGTLDTASQAYSAGLQQLWRQTPWGAAVQAKSPALGEY